MYYMLEGVYLNSNILKKIEMNFFEEFILAKDAFGILVLFKAYMNKLILAFFMCGLLFI